MRLKVRQAFLQRLYEFRSSLNRGRPVGRYRSSFGRLKKGWPHLHSWRFREFFRGPGGLRFCTFPGQKPFSPGLIHGGNKVLPASPNR